MLFRSGGGGVGGGAQAELAGGGAVTASRMVHSSMTRPAGALQQTAGMRGSGLPTPSASAQHHHHHHMTNGGGGASGGGGGGGGDLTREATRMTSAHLSQAAAGGVMGNSLRRRSKEDGMVPRSKSRMMRK